MSFHRLRSLLFFLLLPLYVVPQGPLQFGLRLQSLCVSQVLRSTHLPSTAKYCLATMLSEASSPSCSDSSTSCSESSCSLVTKSTQTDLCACPCFCSREVDLPHLARTAIPDDINFLLLSEIWPDETVVATSAAGPVMVGATSPEPVDSFQQPNTHSIFQPDFAVDFGPILVNPQTHAPLHRAAAAVEPGDEVTPDDSLSVVICKASVGTQLAASRPRVNPLLHQAVLDAKQRHIGENRPKPPDIATWQSKCDPPEAGHPQSVPQDQLAEPTSAFSFLQVSSPFCIPISFFPLPSAFVVQGLPAGEFQPLWGTINSRLGCSTKSIHHWALPKSCSIEPSERARQQAIHLAHE